MANNCYLTASLALLRYGTELFTSGENKYGEFCGKTLRAFSSQTSEAVLELKSMVDSVSKEFRGSAFQVGYFLAEGVNCVLC